MMPSKELVPTRSVHAVTLAVACVLALLCGCGKRVEEVYPAEGDSYKRDPAYLADLKRCGKERVRLEAAFADASADFTGYMKEKFNGDRARALATGAGRELFDKAERARKAVEACRAETMKLMRERAERAAKDSERIRRGEAKPVRISEQEKK